jgi:hypothetical protein
MKEFSTIEDCEEHFRLQREHEGIFCKRCKSEHHYWLKGKKQWQCKSCKFRTMLLCETVMGKPDDMYGLKGMLELDEGCFKIETICFEKSQIKACRGSTNVQNVLVVVESTPLEDANGNESKHCGYYNMKVIETNQSMEITQAVAVMINPKFIVFSDKSTSYVDLKGIGEGHYTELSGTETTKSKKKWVYNAKRVFNGIYQKISLKYIQLYFNEFCYKLNRRYFGAKLLNRITLAMAKMY